MMTRTLTMTVAAALALAIVTPTMAGSIEPGDRMEVAAILKAPVSPTQAVQTAEADGGDAYGCGMEANRFAIPG